MKRLLILISLSAFTVSSYAQIDEHSIDYELGKGLNIISNGGKQHFNFGGYVQAEGKYTHIPDDNAEKRFGLKRVYLNTSGKIFDDKFSYMIQMDLTKSYPLLDAWAAYHPTKNIKISVGQKQSFSGPRSMMYFDQALSLADRSLADTTFFNDGRELGLFVETRNKLGKVGLDLAAAVTSGDGKNSFGSSSTDFDLGGAKYTGRATLFPLGFFTGYNDYRGADFAREKTVKIALGSSYSYNVGASDKIGEGHGTISLYDTSGKFNFPDYQKISVDFLLKYRGFTFLSEYINAVASNLDDIYVQPSINAKLQPKQIADYLVLGNGFNFEAGYLFKNNWAIDVRYSTVMPEWEDKTMLIQKTNEYTGGIAKYFIDNRIKLQLLGSYKQMPNNSSVKDFWHAGFVAHIVL